MIEQALDRAAAVIARADAILVGAGAGMGVDSGLPDFRGNQGFWRAYPPYQRLGLDFVSLANPRWFADDPTLAWGFYGHRMGLYRRTTPHAGFSILRRLGRNDAQSVASSSLPTSTATSSAGFDPERIVEVHGSFARHAMHERLRHRDLPGRADSRRGRRGNDAGRTALTSVS